MDEEEKLLKPIVVRANVHDTITELHPMVKEQLHAILTVYVDTQL